MRVFSEQVGLEPRAVLASQEPQAAQATQVYFITLPDSCTMHTSFRHQPCKDRGIQEDALCGCTVLLDVFG